MSESILLLCEAVVLLPRCVLLVALMTDIFELSMVSALHRMLIRRCISL